MTQALATNDEKLLSLKRGLDAIKNELTAAVPLDRRASMTPERIKRQVMSVVTANPYLLRCEPRSLLGSVIRAAELGLELSGPLGHSYIVPYGSTATLIIGYSGLVDLACRSPEVSALDAHVVYEGDEFSIEYGDPKRPLTHKPCLKAEDQGEPLGAYAVAYMKDGTVVPEWLTKDAILKVKAASKAKGGPWSDPAHEMEMWRKTAIRRLAKRLPKSPGLQVAVGLEELLEMGGDQRNADVVQANVEEATTPATEKQVKYVQSLRSQLVKKLGVPLERCTVHLQAALDDDAALWPAREIEEQWLGEQLSKAQAAELITLLDEEKVAAAEEAEVE